MVRRVKSSKAGFVISASNLTPDNTLADVLALKEKNGLLHRGHHRGRHPQREAPGPGDQPGLPRSPA